MGQLALQTNRRLAHELTVLQQVETFLSALTDMETGQRGFVLTGREEYLQPYTKARNQIETLIASLQALDAKGDLPHESVARIIQLTRDKTAELAKTIELRKTQGPSAALAEVGNDLGKRLMDSIREGVIQLERRENTKLQALVERSRTAAAVRTATFVSATLFNLAFLIWAGRVILNAVRNREAAAQEALNQKALLSTTLASIGDAVIVTNAQCQVTFSNREAQRLTGWSTADVLGKPISEIFPITNELTGQPVQNPIAKVLQHGKTVGLANHTILLTKDGRHVPIDDSAAPVRDEGGVVHGVVMVFRDVTERRRTEQALQRNKQELADDLASITSLNQLAVRFASEHDMKALLEDMVDAAITITHAAKGNLQLFDPSTGTLSIAASRGFSKEWLSFFQTVHNDPTACAQARRTKQRAIIEDVRTSPVFAGTPAQDVQLNDGVMAVQSTPLLSRSGELLGILSTHFTQTHTPGEAELHWLDLLCRQAADLLEHNRAEAALREIGELARNEFAQLEAIYQAAPLALGLLDLELRFRRVNQRFAQYNGIPREAHIGRRIHDVVPSMAAQAEHVLKKVLQRGESVRFEFHGETAAQPGVQRIWDAHWYPLRDAAGAIQFVGVVAEEITERKRMEADLERARTQLQSHAAILQRTVDERTAHLRATIAELEAFSYSLSHDMRAPLRAIQSFSQIVMEEAGERLQPMEKDLLAKASSAASRLDRLIQDVLTYSRVVRGSVKLSDVNVDHLLSQIIEERPEFQPPNSEIQVQHPLEPVRGHEAYLTQCFTNLLDNGVKFVPKGQRPHIRIRNEVLDGHVRIWFEDNGIGIPKDAQHRVFGIFERIHAESAYPGTGIGLAIVRKAAERMGGTVGVDSEPGHGSRFWLQLPRAGNP
jgi:PAS domain S-box-containing protein